MSKPNCTLLFALLTACAPEPVDPNPPQLSFLSPIEASTVATGDVAVSLLVEHFTLVETESSARVPTSSPWPLRALVAEARAHNEEGVPAGYVQLILDEATPIQLADTQTTFTEVTASPHTIRAELFYADGDPLEARVMATVSFNAE